jgi:hypothetical protein
MSTIHDTGDLHALADRIETAAGELFALARRDALTFEQLQALGQLQAAAETPLIEYLIDDYLPPWPADIAAEMLTAWKTCGHHGRIRVSVFNA